jgi:histidinol-phosphate/aromatic aminotransferase/cobyric acid decarboxylase-like protein
MSRMLDNVPEMIGSVARNNEGKHFFLEEMRSLGFKVLATASNFVHVAFGDRSRDIHAALSKKVLYRASFDHPCLVGYSRFTVAPSAIMAQVVDAIKQVVGKKP